MPEKLEFQIDGDSRGFQRAMKEAAAHSERMTTSLRKLAGESDDAEKELDDVGDATKRVGRAAAKATKETKSLTGGILKLAVGFNLVDRAINIATSALSGLVRGVIAAHRAGFDLNLSFEVMAVRLQGVTGSMTSAQSALKIFRGIAATTAFTVRDVSEAGTTLAAFMGGEFTKNIESTTKAVADLSAFMGLTATEGAAAMGRAFAGGAGAADILRERGILNLVKSFKGIEDLTKLTLPEFRAALMDTMVNTAGPIAGATDRMSMTTVGAISNMGDAWENFTARLTESAMPELRSFALAATSVFTKAAEEISGEKGLANAIAKITEAIKANEPEIVKTLTSIAEAAGLVARALSFLPEVVETGLQISTHGLSKLIPIALGAIEGRAGAPPRPGSREATLARIEDIGQERGSLARVISRATYQPFIDESKAAMRQLLTEQLRLLASLNPSSLNALGSDPAIAALGPIAVARAFRDQQAAGRAAAGTQRIRQVFPDARARTLPFPVATQEPIGPKQAAETLIVGNVARVLQDIQRGTGPRGLLGGALPGGFRGADPMFRGGRGLSAAPRPLGLDEADPAFEAARLAAQRVHGPFEGGTRRSLQESVRGLKEQARALGINVDKFDEMATGLANLGDQEDALQSAIDNVTDAQDKQNAILKDAAEALEKQRKASARMTIANNLSSATNRKVGNAALAAMDAMVLYGDAAVETADKIGAFAFAAEQTGEALGGAKGQALSAAGRITSTAVAAATAFGGNPYITAGAAALQLGVEISNAIDQGRASWDKLADSVSERFAGIAQIIGDSIAAGFNSRQIKQAVDQFVRTLITQIMTAKIVEAMFADDLERLETAIKEGKPTEHIIQDILAGVPGAVDQVQGAAEAINANALDVPVIPRGGGALGGWGGFKLGAPAPPVGGDAGGGGRTGGISVTTISGGFRDTLQSLANRRDNLLTEIRDAIRGTLGGGGGDVALVAPGGGGGGTVIHIEAVHVQEVADIADINALVAGQFDVQMGRRFAKANRSKGRRR